MRFCCGRLRRFAQSTDKQIDDDDQQHRRPEQPADYGLAHERIPWRGAHAICPRPCRRPWPDADLDVMFIVRSMRIASNFPPEGARSLYACVHIRICHRKSSNGRTFGPARYTRTTSRFRTGTGRRRIGSGRGRHAWTQRAQTSWLLKW